jgi:hypothetical protein
MQVLPSAFDPLIVKEFWVRTSVSLLMLCCAGFVIISPRFKATQKHWAYGIVGTILGYWLKP